MSQPITPIEDKPGQLVRGHASKIENEKPASKGHAFCFCCARVLELETFTTLEKGNFGHMVQKEPYVFNHTVNVRRYRIIVEEIPEPEHVIRERLIKFWQTSNNIHHMGPLKEMAKRLNIDLPSKSVQPKR
jgi:hypothetical protein